MNISLESWSEGIADYHTIILIDSVVCYADRNKLIGQRYIDGNGEIYKIVDSDFDKFDWKKVFKYLFCLYKGQHVFEKEEGKPSMQELKTSITPKILDALGFPENSEDANMIKAAMHRAYNFQEIISVFSGY
jgi:hypothetical protein